MPGKATGYGYDLQCVTRSIFGDRYFAAASPRLRNSLPINLRRCHSLEQFKRLLKTLLFSASGHGALWHLPKSAPYINLLTYLLTYDLDLPLAMISSSSLLDAMLTNTFLDGCCLLSNVYPKVDVMHAFMLLICAVMLSFFTSSFGI